MITDTDYAATISIPKFSDLTPRERKALSEWLQSMAIYFAQTDTVLAERYKAHLTHRKETT